MGSNAHLSNIRDIIPMPKGLKDELDFQTFIDNLRAVMNSIPREKRKIILFDLVCYVASLCELFFEGRKMGALKKEACIKCLEGFDRKENISNFIEIAVQHGLIEKKTFSKQIKLFIKKKFGHQQQKIC